MEAGNRNWEGRVSLLFRGRVFCGRGILAWLLLQMADERKAARNLCLFPDGSILPRFLVAPLLGMTSFLNQATRSASRRKETVETEKGTEYTVGSMIAQLPNSYYWYRFTWHPYGWRGASL